MHTFINKLDGYSLNRQHCFFQILDKYLVRESNTKMYRGQKNERTMTSC